MKIKLDNQAEKLLVMWCVHIISRMQVRPFRFSVYTWKYSCTCFYTCTRKKTQIHQGVPYAHVCIYICKYIHICVCLCINKIMPIHYRHLHIYIYINKYMFISDSFTCWQTSDQQFSTTIFALPMACWVAKSSIVATPQIPGVRWTVDWVRWVRWVGAPNAPKLWGRHRTCKAKRSPSMPSWRVIWWILEIVLLHKLVKLITSDWS